MGLTSVLKDTPEKKRSRDKLLNLFNSESFYISPSIWADNGFSSIILHAQTAFDDDVRLAQVCSTEQTQVSLHSISSWACGLVAMMPSSAEQLLIASQLKAELRRMAAAIDND